MIRSCLAFLAVCLCAALAPAAEPSSRPNIVLIYADDIGYGDVGCYGATQVRTPHIDRLAREGLRFTDAHCGSATCTPSRYAMLTGEYAWQKKGTGVLPGDAALIIAPGRTTLASVLKRAGYQTAVVGKWHLGLGAGALDWNGKIAPGPLEVGFDYCFLMPATGDRVPCVYVENDRVVGLDPSDPLQVRFGQKLGTEPTGKEHSEMLKMRPSHGHDQTIVNGVSRIGYMSGGQSARWVDEDMADVFVGKARAFVRRHVAAQKDRPFFLYFASHDIHVPRIPHQRFAGKSGLGPRGDAIVQFDWCVGELLTLLDELHLRENTLVIFTSDNGPVIDDGYQDEAVAKLGAHRPAGPLRGGKYSNFEGGTRVPFVVRWPARVEPSVSDALVCQVDFPASFAALVEQKLDRADSPDSQNMLASLLGESPRGRDALVEHAGSLALRQGPWKFIEKGAGAKLNSNTNTELGNSAEYQLYNLEKDLGESTNVAERYPEKVRELSVRLNQIRTPTPNILWLVSEDHGPHLGCYGDTFATTPNIDKLAARGLLYRKCWSNAPVCAPARTTLITGLYAPSCGAEHMRSFVAYPQGQHMFPQLLRETGYYCTNNAKEDYNIAKPGKVWDESSQNAHWKKRPAEKPFFAVFNSEKSHESKLRVRPHKQIHEPAKVRIPAYHPDTSEVREDWAQYYDTVTEADADAGRRLEELAAAGLADDTIVFYYADHGSGMPRNKRWPYNSGLHVPLIVYIPEKFKDLRPSEYQSGGRSDRLVSFVDFAPTLLSLAGIKPPAWMQGHAFLGKFIASPQPFVYGFRGRMDERYDLVRSVTDGRYVYVRQYLPHLIYGQHVAYMFETPTTRVWKRLHDEGKLTREQDTFWNSKPAEELYDLEKDPDEVHNLANSAEHQEILSRLRTAQQRLAVGIRDLGFVPEGERLARSQGNSPYDFGHTDTEYPVERVLHLAELASQRLPADLPELQRSFTDKDSAVRYWAALGAQMRGKAGLTAARKEVTAALKDDSPYVRLVAAQTLAEFGTQDDLQAVLPLLLEHADWSHNDVFVSLAALTVLDALENKAASITRQIKALPVKGKAPDARYNSYVPRLLEDINKRFAEN